MSKDTDAKAKAEAKANRKLKPIQCVPCGRVRGLDCRACLDRARKRVPEKR